MKNIGKYEIRGEIGKGAMGVVYEGFDRYIQRHVAIKTIQKSTLDQSEARDLLNRFRREAQAAGRLHHPNIITIYEYGEDDQLAYIVMEFVTGKELKQYFDKNERFTINDSVDILCQLLEALAYSHKKGVIHRDIKPGNIMLTVDKQVKIADFGIARIESSQMTHVGTVMGTPSHMSPEQFLDANVDHRSDLYSVAVILYQFVTGERPFTGNVATIMHRVLYQEPVPASVLNFSVTGALESVIKKGMAKKPENRFQSAQDFILALRSALNTPATAVPDAEATQFLHQPDKHAAQAQNTNDNILETIRNSQHIEDFELYLQDNPDGEFAEIARSRLAELTTAIGTEAIHNKASLTPHEELIYPSNASDEATLILRPESVLSPNEAQTEQSDSTVRVPILDTSNQTSQDCTVAIPILKTETPPPVAEDATVAIPIFRNPEPPIITPAENTAIAADDQTVQVATLPPSSGDQTIAVPVLVKLENTIQDNTKVDDVPPVTAATAETPADDGTIAIANVLVPKIETHKVEVPKVEVPKVNASDLEKVTASETTIEPTKLESEESTLAAEKSVPETLESVKVETPPIDPPTIEPAQTAQTTTKNTTITSATPTQVKQSKSVLPKLIFVGGSILLVGGVLAWILSPKGPQTPSQPPISIEPTTPTHVVAASTVPEAPIAVPEVVSAPVETTLPTSAVQAMEIDKELLKTIKKELEKSDQKEKPHISADELAKRKAQFLMQEDTLNSTRREADAKFAAEQQKLQREKNEFMSKYNAELAKLEKEDVSTKIRVKELQSNFDKIKAEAERVIAWPMNSPNERAAAQASLQAEQRKFEQQKAEIESKSKSEHIRLEKDKHDFQQKLQQEQAKLERNRSDFDASLHTQQANVDKLRAELAELTTAESGKGNEKVSAEAKSAYQQAVNYEKQGDMSNAVRWYITATNAGHKVAKKRLSEIYAVSKSGK